MSDGCVRGHIFVDGRVQGVGFRMSAVARAERLRLGGWVRNCRDGRVEAVVEGPREAVFHFRDWCRRGPAMAQVTRLTENYEDVDGVTTSFRIR